MHNLWPKLQCHAHTISCPSRILHKEAEKNVGKVGTEEQNGGTTELRIEIGRWRGLERQERRGRGCWAFGDEVCTRERGKGGIDGVNGWGGGRMAEYGGECEGGSSNGQSMYRSSSKESYGEVYIANGSHPSTRSWMIWLLQCGLITDLILFLFLLLYSAARDTDALVCCGTWCTQIMNYEL